MLHPKVREFKLFMEERPDLKRKVRQKQTTLQALFEEWHLSGDVQTEAHSEKGNKQKEDFQEEDLTAKLAKVMSLFEGMKWSSILEDVQGMLEMAQIYLADFAEQQQKK
ncbi:spore coat protein YlbD [Pseudobacillus badius]|uniref:Uncharacterized protein n=2 Tax=Bacillus badius TaxID=1455 RepID=A0ABR5B0R8_BACBA|nr:spore coat protein YlbD [Bacillus badius]KIL73451.1 hypothetical protein SD78_3639 [Bacillus badius]KIL80460.1 hypothetical protein SD77_0308 [Bacillus badius]KZO01559.1 hypothetical protein A4244_00300 [Bacillus badius]KZR57271.1 hypothetical protein A3781_03645 [Bacillus badius]OCS89953.1 hypothetical protein A6M11_00300 [Bacillus badius]